MNGGVRVSVAGVMLGLLALAGCGRGFFQGGEREAWRHEAEAACMKSGAVKLGAGVVQIEPIQGPGICGADFPLKVSALGAPPVMSYADPVPPGSIPNDSRMPNFPPTEQRYLPPARIEVAPGRHEEMRWMTGPPPAVRPPTGEPMQLDPQAGAPQQYYTPPPQAYPQQRYAPPPSRYEPPPSRYESPPQPRYAPPAMRAAPVAPPQSRALPDDIPPDAEIPPAGSAAVQQQNLPPSYPPQRDQRSYNAPIYQPPPASAPPPLGPPRAPYTAAIPQAELTPAATLACPLVSALDRWVSEGVQPAALRWFGSPVVGIKQISAYSCRAMVGAGTGHISEHAFGNAIDVAAFTLADGRTITVKDGWHGSPEEQGFLHDVQGYACDIFTTVLSPGYNAAHYNHIHVDLMRRGDGRHPCRPEAIPGEVAAAQARSRYAAKHRLVTGSIPHHLSAKGKPMQAVPGEDGEDDDDEPVTGAIAAPPPAARPAERRSQIY